MLKQALITRTVSRLCELELCIASGLFGLHTFSVTTPAGSCSSCMISRRVSRPDSGGTSEPVSNRRTGTTYRHLVLPADRPDTSCAQSSMRSCLPAGQ